MGKNGKRDGAKLLSQKKGCKDPGEGRTARGGRKIRKLERGLGSRIWILGGETKFLSKLGDNKLEGPRGKTGVSGPGRSSSNTQ